MNIFIRLPAIRLALTTLLFSLIVSLLVPVTGHAESDCDIGTLRSETLERQLSDILIKWPIDSQVLPSTLAELMKCLDTQIPWTAREDDTRDIRFRVDADTPINSIERLSDLAMMLRHRGAYQLAVQLQQQVTMRFPDNNVELQLSSQSRLALLQQENEQLNEALTTLHTAEQLLSQASIAAQAEYHDVYGRVLGALGQWDEALKAHKNAIKLLQPTSPSVALAEAISNAGNAHYYKSRLEQARDLSREAALMRELLYSPEHPINAESQHNLATIFGALGQLQAAVDLQQSALKKRRAAYGDRHPIVASSLNNLALLFSQQGEQERALKLINQACQIVFDFYNADSLRAATCYHNQSYHLKRLGRYAEALQKQLKTLDIRQKHLPSPHPRIANALDNLGQLYYALGDTSKQLTNLQQAYDQRQQLYTDDHEDLANSLNNVGFAHAVRGDLEQAQRFIEAALAMRERLSKMDNANRDIAIAIGKSNLGHVELLLGNTERAVLLNTDALQLLQASDGVVVVHFAQIYNNLAEIARSERRYQDAEGLLLKALALLGGRREPLLQAKIESNMAYTLYQLARLDLAILYQKNAVNRVMRQRTDLSAEQSSLYLRSHEDWFRRLAKWLIEAKRLKEANQVLDTMDIFQHRQFVRSEQQPVDIALSQQEQASDTGLQSLLLRISENISDWLSGDIETINEDVRQRHRSLVENEKKRSEYDHIPDCKVIPAANSSEVQTFIARYAVFEEELLITMEAGEQRQSCRRSIARSHLASMVADFRDSILTGRSADYRGDLRLNQQLYQLLFKPLAQFIGNQTPEQVVVNPDSAISFIPFSALHDGQMYIGARYPLMRRTGPFNNDHLTLQQPRIAGFGLSEEHKVAYEAGALPWVRVELDEVIDTGIPDVGILPGEMYLDDRFVPQQYYDTLQRQAFNILHLTGHFVFQYGSLSTSFFQTGDGQYLFADRLIRGKPESDSALDGVEILMLPSCDTALGNSDIARLGSERLPRERHYEGESLATEAMISGARTVVASLWKINDASTANFVRRFYAYLESGTEIPRALMYTRRDFIEQQLRCIDAVNDVRRQYRHDPFLQQNINVNGCTYDWNRPYFWAGLTLFGN